jgi:putative ABC transport system substrate-binding protein
MPPPVLGSDMQRREFMTVLCSAVAAWPLVARAQRLEQIRKIGMLVNYASEDPEGQARVRAFAQALQKLGWTEGNNVRTETRWASDDANRYRRYAEELGRLCK